MSCPTHVPVAHLQPLGHLSKHVFSSCTRNDGGGGFEPGTRKRTIDFESTAFNHSAISPIIFIGSFVHHEKRLQRQRTFFLQNSDIISTVARVFECMRSIIEPRYAGNHRHTWRVA